MSALPIAELTSASAEIRRRACEVIADACEAGAPLEAAAEPVVELLGDPDRGVRDLAAFILQTEVDRDARGRGAEALRDALSNGAVAVRTRAATLLAGGLARHEQGAAVATLIDNADRDVRLGALTALAEGALPRAEVDAVIAALVTALSDDELAVRKEAIWALYLLGSDGAALAAAVPALELALADTATQGNAAIALSLAWSAANDPLAPTLFAGATPAIQLGAAWGAADVHLRRGELAALEAMFSDDNDNVRRGLGGFLHYAKQRGRDISLAGVAFNALQRQHPDDAMLHARLFAVLEIVEHGPPG